MNLLHLVCGISRLDIQRSPTGWLSSCHSRHGEMFRKVKKRHSSSSSQSSEISTKSKVRTTNNKLVIFIFKGKSKLVPPKKSLSLYILAPVCRLQLGRTFQIQYCCQSWHRLYQELRFVAVLWYCSLMIWHFLGDWLTLCRDFPQQATVLQKPVRSSESSMWERLKSCILTWAKPYRSLSISSITLMLLRWTTELVVKQPGCYT